MKSSTGRWRRSRRAEATLQVVPVFSGRRSILGKQEKNQRIAGGLYGRESPVERGVPGRCREARQGTSDGQQQVSSGILAGGQLDHSTLLHAHGPDGQVAPLPFDTRRC